MESAPVGLGIVLAQWSGRVQSGPLGEAGTFRGTPSRKVLSLGLAHYPGGPSRGGKKRQRLLSARGTLPTPPPASFWASSR